MAVPKSNEILQFRFPPDGNCSCFLSGAADCYCNYWTNEFIYSLENTDNTDNTGTIPLSDFYLAPDPEPDPPPPPQLSLEAQIQAHNSEQLHRQLQAIQAAQTQRLQRPSALYFAPSPLLNTPILDFEHSHSSTPIVSSATSPWIPISATGSPHVNDVSFSSFDSPVPDLNIAESPGNFAVSPPANAVVAWPNAGYGLGFDSTTHPTNQTASTSLPASQEGSHSSRCDVCSLSFPTRKELKRHQSVAHEKGLAFRCRIDGCIKARSGHIYNRRDNFVRHLKTAHTDTGNFDMEDMVKTCGFTRGSEADKHARRRK